MIRCLSTNALEAVYVVATFIFCVIAFTCLNVCTKMTLCESRITDLLRLSRNGH